MEVSGKPVSPTVVLYAAKNLNYHTPNSCKCSYGSQWVSLAAACSLSKVIIFNTRDVRIPISSTGLKCISKL